VHCPGRRCGIVLVRPRGRGGTSGLGERSASLMDWIRVSTRPVDANGTTAPFGLLGELQPLARQLLVLALELEIANVARELPAFCRMGAEFFGTGLHTHSLRQLGAFSRSSPRKMRPARPPVPDGACLRGSPIAPSPRGRCDRRHTNASLAAEVREIDRCRKRSPGRDCAFWRTPLVCPLNFRLCLD